MFIETTCKVCGGTGKHRREIRVGDVVTPQDGSAMCHALHRILFRGTGMGFKPVRVVAIEGDMLGVVPVHWDNWEVRNKEMYRGDLPASDASVWIWKGTYANNQVVVEAGFWINAHISHLSLY